MSKIDALYEAAQKAHDAPDHDEYWPDIDRFRGEFDRDTAAFLTRANPQTVMALIAEHRAAMDYDMAWQHGPAWDGVRAAIKKVEALG